jgi:hypothetical protein
MKLQSRIKTVMTGLPCISGVVVNEIGASVEKIRVFKGKICPSVTHMNC